MYSAPVMTAQIGCALSGADAGARRWLAAARDGAQWFAASLIFHSRAEKQVTYCVAAFID